MCEPDSSIRQGLFRSAAFELLFREVTGPIENGEVSARTAFLVSRSHLETDHQLLSGSREDVLRKKRDGTWQVARRTILLDANVLLDKNLSVFF
jgi:3-phenylpropionate/cinnamic acid dioxygenase small subunit